MPTQPISFNADFWVVLGTAAPVIALSAILVNSDMLRLNQDLSRITGKDIVPFWKWPYYPVALWGLLALAVTFIQALTLFASLMSLVQGRNYAPAEPMAVVETLSIMGLAMCTLQIVRLRGFVSHVERVHFPPQKAGAIPDPFRKSRNNVVIRANRYQPSRGITHARAAKQRSSSKTLRSRSIKVSAELNRRRRLAGVKSLWICRTRLTRRRRGSARRGRCSRQCR
jgi:hypothetical protein